MNAVLKHPFVALLRRELWEHRAFWMVPGIMAGVFTLMLGWQMSFGTAREHIDAHEAAVRLDRIATADPGQLTDTIASMYLGMSVAFGIAFGFIAAFYLLDCLYGDRRDRSFLFWKSMPVSDVSTVLSKFVTAVAVGPTIALGIAAACMLVWTGMFTIFAASIGVEHWGMALVPMAFIQYLGKGLMAILLIALIYAPHTGWFMLASAWAKRAPFLWAVLPPVIVATGEYWVFGTQVFADSVLRHGRLLVETAFTADETPAEFALDGAGHFKMSFMHMGVHADVLAEPRLWIGVLVGAGLIAAAIVVRRYREEA